MTDTVAGRGLLSRRLLLGSAAGIAGTSVLGPAFAQPRMIGPPPSARGEPAAGARLAREGIGTHPLGPSAGASMTPLQDLQGTITPNAVHFERHHSGIPDLDADRHQLTIHGDVTRPLTFDLASLHRYPHVSRICFVECSGNSRRNMLDEALDLTCGNLHGLLSTSEWTGVPLRVLLDEAGLSPEIAAGGWVIAEGDDAGRMNRSLPMALSDDAMIALYQNGEPLRPAQGYPMRLLVPGCEGNLSVKWLRSLRVQSTAAYTRDETSKYTDLQDDGRAEMFTLRMDVKSTITRPSGRMALSGPGVYEITGIAWSGHGAVRRVEVSADGGRSWADALIQTEPGDRRPTRFRIPWRWDGGPAVLQSRATDTRGVVQPSREAYFSVNRPARFYHYNGIQSWAVDGDGRVRNVHG